MSGDLGGSTLLESVLASTRLGPSGEGRVAGPNVALAGYRRLFGGQLLAQAMAAAAGSRTLGSNGKTVRSVHLVFTAEGSPDLVVDWAVEGLQDGRTFAAVTVNASQRAQPGGRVLAGGLVSLHRPDPAGSSLEHSAVRPDVSPPEASAPVELMGAMVLETRLARHLDGVHTDGVAGSGTAGTPGRGMASASLDGLEVGPPELDVWMRLVPGLPVTRSLDNLDHKMLLAYSSDLTMMVAAMRPHAGIGYGSPLVGATAVTSHTVTFHREVDLGDWLLFSQQSPAAAGGRAYVRGDWFDGARNVVASCAQEVLIRLAPNGPA